MNINLSPRAKTALYIFIAFAVGIIVAPKTTTQTVEKEVPLQNESDWRQLKAIDDEGFTLCSQFASDTSEMLYSLSQGDFSAVATYTAKTDETAEDITSVAEERQAMLERLGY